MTTDNIYKDRPNIIPWPPIVLVCTIAIGFILSGLVPLGFPRTILGELLFGLGLMLIVLALLIDVSAMRLMRKHQTAILPNRGADKLLTKGIFAFSRNPIYVANIMLIIGLGLTFGTFWHLLLAPVAAFATRKLAIDREEKHLESRFGNAFRTYKKKVNRWV
ncbi:isoprenylcysteine carboxylmethyltransferase family protein [Ahrensia kielensis]|uniref:Isoprenylcysteine carboxylmethyltransferase family protein n=1 Tax=Ahrensia kielensis TaxID=76980 RepID=A0ABU9T3G9_9HYPH